MMCVFQLEKEKKKTDQTKQYFFCCKRCGYALLPMDALIPHRKGTQRPIAEGTVRLEVHGCDYFFFDPACWDSDGIGKQKRDSEDQLVHYSGYACDLRCPHCNVVFGDYNWSGNFCSCRAYLQYLLRGFKRCLELKNADEVKLKNIKKVETKMQEKMHFTV
eukprot:TRINITY_DN698_c1_g2_i9.p1 TRINITY_DN698_c1_g2~~TRINITY_DN698_c1_g2_i9.p1  ORF type:complete len:161 (+),score=29.08 TRINITY_DN698_c1_g2_i9:113-595(+)